MSLVAAINEKYRINEEDFQSSFVKFGKYNTDKAKEYLNCIPESVTLQHYGLDSIGQDEELKELCRNLKTLDLAGNEYASWNAVLLLFKNLPCLELLNLSHNPLLGHFPDPGKIVAEKLKTLILNHINVSWEEISQLQHCLPCLEELHFSLIDKSNIATVDPHQWPSVKCLHCSNSGLATSQDIQALGRMFPSLQSLIIVENPFCDFGDNIEMFFPELKCLNISKTGLSEWNELEKLRKLPKLREIRLKGIPLLDGLSDTHRRQHTIARLPMITILNGSSVGDSERVAAERAFLRFFLSKDKKPSRCVELEEVHKDIVPLVDVDLTPIYVVTCLVIFEEKQKLMKINTKMTILELKKSLKEFVGLPLKQFQLLYRDVQLNQGANMLTFSKKVLYSLNVRDGDEFICRRR
ncbi:tubulin-specific chaperone cofactor E-like protein [Anneissia japonica]|uniref:tubulin-specific chaperone cofactor E-like protein n=1 Tax=Anneissia japonica TaxID=1529436 RepID=UPI001425B60D|nr:tubulin-specific chaperone cofactor E-like protein [Anneissia japonica]XP_033119569.1 tubulin-specific chaperone cofactor E-like protein [Anneissia japonica]XP_033119577.1 tubulin-specific chaperone cofactor E-like protein [Anneissia japonica]